MPFADTSLRDEYAAAVERVAGRTLVALRGGGGADALADAAGHRADRATLAAVRVLGPDLFAPRAFADQPSLSEGKLTNDARQFADEARQLADEARQAFPPPPAAPESAETRLVAGWQDWATGQLTGSPVHLPDEVPQLEPDDWQRWSVRMARLSALALPGLDSPLHRLAREQKSALARGAVRSMLRRDHRTATRLTRWLAWHRHQGLDLPLEVTPLLERLRPTGDGSARTELELTIAHLLLLSNGAEG